MKVSTRTRYGVRAMSELALRYGQGPTSVRDIAERQQLPAKYLEQLVASLRTAKLVRSQRGIGGGYTLARPPEEITVADIYTALEGPLVPVDCVSDADLCARSEECVTRGIWSRVAQAMLGALSSVTLADLARDLESRCRISSPSAANDDNPDPDAADSSQ